MGVDAATPPGLWERVRMIAQEEVAKLLRSGLLRNASISGGGLTIKGGFLRMLSAVTGGVDTFYVGPITPALPDGSYQPSVIIRRNDGTVALLLWDPIPDPGGPSGYSQFLGWYDRAGNAIFTDDTDSGEGIARPWLQGSFYPARVGDFPLTAATAFETVWRCRLPKQQPKLYVEAWGNNDTAAATGEVRVMVNGTQLGPTRATASGVVSGLVFGPEAVAGNFGETLEIEIQARRAAGAGNVRVGAASVQGQQS